MQGVVCVCVGGGGGGRGGKGGGRLFSWISQLVLI